MKKSLISVVFALSAIVACNKDNASLIPVQYEATVTEVIPMEEALANLEMFLSSYSTVTKSAKTRSIDDAEVIPFGSGTVKTRSNNTQ